MAKFKRRTTRGSGSLVTACPRFLSFPLFLRILSLSYFSHFSSISKSHFKTLPLPSLSLSHSRSLSRFKKLQKIQRRRMLKNMGGVLNLTSLNHISLVCRSVEKSLEFYQGVLGFTPIRRPGSFDFDGAWLFRYGIGIHLLQSENPEALPKKNEINPKDNHISFQCESMAAVARKLEEMEILYIQRQVEECGIYVDQLFFHDPDGFMIEVCNCDNLPVVPLFGDSIRACKRLGFEKHLVDQQQVSPSRVKCIPSIQVNEEIPLCM